MRSLISLYVEIGKQQLPQSLFRQPSNVIFADDLGFSGAIWCIVDVTDFAEKKHGATKDKKHLRPFFSRLADQWDASHELLIVTIGLTGDSGLLV